jgi:uncharacterized protein (TIGR02996 family)
MSAEAAFLDAIRSKPDDAVTRLVYADWLDEQGGKANAAKSAVLRFQCEFAALAATTKIGGTKKKRLRRLANSVADANWLALVSMPAIEKCELKFAFKCPKQWDKLTATRDDAVRYCDACQRNVYYCHTIPEAFRHAVEGDCVAVQLTWRRSKGDLDQARPLELTVGVVAEAAELGEIALDDDLIVEE